MTSTTRTIPVTTVAQEAERLGVTIEAAGVGNAPTFTPLYKVRENGSTTLAMSLSAVVGHLNYLERRRQRRA